jgi:hypothetical protein
LSRFTDYKDVKTTHDVEFCRNETLRARGFQRSYFWFSLVENSMSDSDESTLETSGGGSADVDNTHSIAGRARVRAQLQADIEAFLSQGGIIREVANGFRRDGGSNVDSGFNGRAL